MRFRLTRWIFLRVFEAIKRRFRKTLSKKESLKKTKANRFSEDGQIRGFSKTLTSELVTPLQMR